MASAHRYTWTRADGTTGKAWRAKWTGPDGRACYKRGFDRKGDAEGYAADREAEARHGVTLAGERPTSRTTVREWGQTWLASRPVRPSSLANYQSALARINATLGSRPVAALRPSEIAAWRKVLEGKYAESTVTNTATILGMLLSAAVQDGLREQNPMPRGSRGTSRTTLDPEQVLTMEQVRAWAAKMPKHLRPAPVVAAQTGLRRGELLGLRPCDVDFLGGKVSVDHQLGAARTYVPTKTRASVRVVPLTDEVRDLLAAHLAAYPCPDGEPIFRNSRGARLTTSTFWGSEQPAREAAKLPTWATWHALRDVYASALIHLGLDLRLVMTLMGHTSSEETLRTYARLWPQATEVAGKALSGLWADAPGATAVPLEAKPQVRGGRER